jgi:hypothetical protein
VVAINLLPASSVITAISPDKMAFDTVLAGIHNDLVLVMSRLAAGN